MAKIHMILQGKGGVGKSLIAALLAQYKMNTGQQPLCIDTDPVNATFHGFQGLNVKRLQIMENEEINPRNFDTLVELIAPATDDVIIDNAPAHLCRFHTTLIATMYRLYYKKWGMN